MRLWLDDTRPAPEGWTWARSYDEFQELYLRHVGDIEEMSLDHDLGDGCGLCWTQDTPEHPSHVVANVCGYVGGGACSKLCGCHLTGYDAVMLMRHNQEEHGLLPPCRPRVHSMNPVGRARMEQLLRHMYGEG